jgi:putative nucleotidyltransferase with HDIG domain
MDIAVLRPVRVHDARDIARVVLGDLPDRWQHTVGVARRAEEVATTVPAEDREDLVAAAWLHDIGYAEELVDTGFHPLDGARFLDRHLWPPRVSALVAHHSGAAFVADARGLSAELGAYPREESAVADALTYADQTVGPDGCGVALERRMADMLRRRGPDSPNALVHHVRAPYLRAVADRVEWRVALA